MTPSTEHGSLCDFDNVLEQTLGVFTGLPGLKHVSGTKLRQVCLDLTVVAFGIRSGYLFDAFVLRDRQKTLRDLFVKVLTLLRQRLPCYGEIVLVHDQDSDQLFFVSTRVLATYIDGDTGELSQSLLSWVSFIGLCGSHAKVSVPPAGLLGMLQFIVHEAESDAPAPVLVSLPEFESKTLGDMVALAACILEFPVAYVPDPNAEGGSAFLAGVPLDVYECMLVRSGGNGASDPLEEHTMLKFSCPQAIGREVVALEVMNLKDRLAARFSERLGASTTTWKFVIRHTLQTMDRVAL